MTDLCRTPTASPAAVRRTPVGSRLLGACISASISACIGASISACGADTSASAAATVRDSAGVRIIDNAGDVWAAPEKWRLAPEPAVHIGAVDGAAPYLFGAIIGIAPLSDGRIVVADAAGRTLRWYDAAGVFLFERGGAGGGPGEFEQLGGITLAGDTVIAWDPAVRRVTAFAPDGTLTGTIPLTSTAAAGRLAHRLGDGSLVLLETDPGPPRPLTEPSRRTQRYGARLLRVAADGSRADTIAGMDGPELFVRRQDGRLSVTPPYFARGVSWAADAERVYAAPQDPFEIRVYAADGAWLRSIRAPDIDLELGPQHVAAFRDWMISRLDGRPAAQRSELIRSLDERLADPLPGRVPAFSTLLLDPHGNVWVGEYRFELNLHPPDRWVVFDADGRIVSVVRTPPDFTVLAVGRDHVFGRATDELNVHYVVGWRIER
jgi:hypothetical protein